MSNWRIGLTAVALASTPYRRYGLRPATGNFHRDRRDRRRLLSARRWARQCPVEGLAGHSGNGGSDRRLGRQSEADQFRQQRDCLLDGRCRARRLQRPRQIQGHGSAGPHPDGALSEPDARGHDRRDRHREDVRPQRQARVDRLRRQRNGSHGIPRDRGGRSRQRQGHETRTAWRRRVGQRDQGSQDRCILLGRWPADVGCDRSRRHPRRQDSS